MNQAHHLLNRHLVARASRLDDVFFEHDAAEVVRTEAQRQLPDALALRDPRALDVRDVVEVEARQSQRRQVVPRACLLAAKLRVAGLKRPCDEGAEAARLVLQAAHLLHVLDAVGHRLAEADDHRRRALHADRVRRLHDAQPIVRHDLLRRNPLADAVDEDLRAAARQAVESRRLQALQCLLDGKPRLLCEVEDLRRRERVDRQHGKLALQAAQHFLVIGKTQLRMQAALNHQLRAARLDRLTRLFENFLVGEQVGVRRVQAAVEGAEAALVAADVRIVDVAVDDERRAVAVARAPHGIGLAAERDRILCEEKSLALLFRQAHYASSSPLANA